jgi:hypothetical protein
VAAAAVRSFAEAVDPLVEARTELAREIRYALAEWHVHGDDELRGRLLQLLETLALLVRVRG